MHGVIACTMVVPKIMDLGMAVMTARNTIICTGGNDLLVFELAVVPAGVCKPGLQESATAAAAVVI